MRILIAEDNDANWDMLSRRLIKREFVVERAETGAQAVEKARAFDPDIILMDVNLPVMDGLEATRHIRENEKTRTIPIIALTAHALAGDREKAIAAGCNAYHSKPLDLASLLVQIRELVTIEAGNDGGKPLD